MNKKHTFITIIQNAGGGGAFVEVPFDVEAAFGSKRPKVQALIEGVTYRGTLTRMGGPNHILIILKSIRAQIGKTFGDEIKVSVELDVEERVAIVPAELKRLFKSDQEAKSAFEKLSYSHQKEYVKWIDEAKRTETRAQRVAQTIKLLKGRQVKTRQTG